MVIASPIGARAGRCIPVVMAIVRRVSLCARIFGRMVGAISASSNPAVMSFWSKRGALIRRGFFCCQLIGAAEMSLLPNRWGGRVPFDCAASRAMIGVGGMIAAGIAVQIGVMTVRHGGGSTARDTDLWAYCQAAVGA